MTARLPRSCLCRSVRRAGHPGGVADAFEILAEVALDGDGHPVLEQVFPAGQQFRRQIPEALFGILAVRGAAEIHLGVEHPLAALLAAAAGFVFEKFHLPAALGARGFKNAPPVSSSGYLVRGIASVDSCGSRLWSCENSRYNPDRYGFPTPRNLNFAIVIIPESPSDPHPRVVMGLMLKFFTRKVQHVGRHKGRQAGSQADVLNTKIQQGQQNGHRLLFVPGQDHGQRQIIDPAR